MKEYQHLIGKIIIAIAIIVAAIIIAGAIEGAGANIKVVCGSQEMHYDNSSLYQ